MAQHNYRFITIPASHYVEKARWALDLGSVPYTESKWPPVLHMLGSTAGFNRQSVPVLLTPDGKRLTDSTDILHHVAVNYPAGAHLYPASCREEVERLEASFSKRLGVFTRVVAYHYMFQGGKAAVISTVCDGGISLHLRMVFWVFYWPIVALLKWSLRISGAGAARSLKEVRLIFDDVSALLSDGRRFLAGTPQPSAADITFAALSAPLLNPPNYGGRLQLKGLPVTCTSLPGWPSDLKETPAGKHALKLYEHYRLPKLPQQTQADSAGKPQSTVTARL